MKHSCWGKWASKQVSIMAALRLEVPMGWTTTCGLGEASCGPRSQVWGVRLVRHRARREAYAGPALRFRRKSRFRPRAEFKDDADSDSRKSSRDDGTGTASAVEDSNKREPAQKVEGTNGRLDTEKKQEVDWKKDEDFRRFMSNPSIETALKLEKKRTEEKIRQLQLSSQDSGNIFQNFFRSLVLNAVQKEKERLDKVGAKFKALDLNKLKSCFGYDTFYATDVRRMGDGGIFIGNLRRRIEEVKPRLEQRLNEAAGCEVDIWFMEQTLNDGEQKQVCVVQPKEEIDLQLEANKLSNLYGYVSALALGVTTAGTIAIMSGFFLQPNATFDDYVARVLPLFGGFVAIGGVSEIATRLTAAKYGVQLSPSFLIPSNWTGCLGVVNNLESLLPNRQALFDIAAARATSAFLTSFVLAGIAFYVDGSFNGGDNALYIRPQFFINNPLLSFVQYVTGPYSDELGNVLPQAVPGVGVPVDPLAFAGLLGMVVTSLNLLPIGRLEGGRIAQALLGRRVAGVLSVWSSVALGVGGLTGSVLCLVWGFVATFFRGGEELPAQDEITAVEQWRYVWGGLLAVLCILTLFPNSAGTFPSAFYTPFFRGDSF